MQNKFSGELKFDNTRPACVQSQLDEVLVSMLLGVSEKLGRPLYINCGYRSSQYDKEKGRSGQSAHCSGKAVDIFCADNTFRYKLLVHLLDVGFVRVGIGKNYIHVDIDLKKPYPRIWHYYV